MTSIYFLISEYKFCSTKINLSAESSKNHAEEENQPPHPYCTYIQSFGSVLNHLLAQPSVEDVTVEPTVEAVAAITGQ